jgi:hypothetical protein
LKYAPATLADVDNDGDTLIDEDSSDEDGDHMFDEDPPGGGNQDTDAFLDEDPAMAQCVPAAVCDDDGDTLVDEDPSCYPLQPTRPAGVCLVSLSITLQGDTDGDGCMDEQEAGLNENLGGRRSAVSPWDFYDANADYVISIPGDILLIAQHFGPSGDPRYDRSAPPSPDEEPDPTLREPWDMGPPDGHVNIPTDILGAAMQFGHSCL